MIVPLVDEHVEVGRVWMKSCIHGNAYRTWMQISHLDHGCRCRQSIECQGGVAQARIDLIVHAHIDLDACMHNTAMRVFITHLM
jgi:hypothetical protein